MRISEQWLRQWVNPSIDTQQLVERLISAGHEVESYGAVAGNFSGVITGQILSVEPHPDADRLRLCKVTVGEGEDLGLVCGGSNVRPQQKVAVAMIGANLDGMKIKKSRIRGVESQGMLCSEAELGLATTSDGTIIELAEDAPLGMDVREYFGLDDNYIEIEIAPNRGDCLSVLGIAREVAALTETPITTPYEQTAVELGSTMELPITIDAPKGCPNYIGRVIRNVNPNATSPLWLQERLRRCGFTPISAIVDVTNYVMFELGQPLHAFDLQKIQDGIRVRNAVVGEKLQLLNGTEAELKPDVLVIADATKPLVIAGVMGGVDSGISNETKDIFLESAFFSPLEIIGRARRYGLHTDSSQRFERGVDPKSQLPAIERATQLLLEIVGGEAGPLTIKKSPEYLPAKINVNLNPHRVSKYLGLDIPAEHIANILQRLHMNVSQETQTNWHIAVPSFRFDVSKDVDMIEEVARVNGYDKIPSNYPKQNLVARQASETQISLQNIRLSLLSNGYQEAITYSFVDEKLQKLLDPEQQALLLLNPIASDMAAMRTNLWPGLIKALQYNQARQQSRVRLFEIGKKYLKQSDGLPWQPLLLAAIAWGGIYPEQWSTEKRALNFFDFKGDLEALLTAIVPDKKFNFVATSHAALHPGQSAKIMLGDQEIGYIGALHPALEQEIGITGPVYLFEMFLDPICVTTLPQFKALSKFPSIRRDIALLVNKDVSAQTIQDEISQVCGELLNDCWVFDVYEGPGIAADQKSLAFALVLQHQDRTLVDEEVNILLAKVMEALQQNLSAVLRE